MAQAGRDQNQVTSLTCASNADGSTPVAIWADASTHGIVIDDATTGSDAGDPTAQRDGSGVPVLLAVSSADGTTPVEVYGNPSTNAIMIDSS